MGKRLVVCQEATPTAEAMLQVVRLANPDAEVELVVDRYCPPGKVFVIDPDQIAMDPSFDLGFGLGFGP